MKVRNQVMCRHKCGKRATALKNPREENLLRRHNKQGNSPTIWKSQFSQALLIQSQGSSRYALSEGRTAT